MRMKWGLVLGLMSLALVGPALAEERVANSSVLMTGFSQRSFPCSRWPGMATRAGALRKPFSFPRSDAGISAQRL